MSFNDLERGQASQPLLRGPAGGESMLCRAGEEDLTSECRRGQGVHGVEGQRLDPDLQDPVECAGDPATGRQAGLERGWPSAAIWPVGVVVEGGEERADTDTEDRHNLTEATREMVKKSTDDVKSLMSFTSGPANVSMFCSGVETVRGLRETAQNTRKPIQTKLSKEFTTALTAFKRVSQLSAERQRSAVESQKRKVDRMVEDNEGVDEPGGSLELEQVQAQVQIPAVSPQELEFQETLIAERETEIRDIESGIHELNDIFRDLGTIIVEQGGLIGKSAFLSNRFARLTSDPDNIENNITSVAQNTSSAAEELTTAHEYQRKAGRRMACLLIILVIVVAIVLLAILS
ncbi:hypothetical protein P7C73_g3507, partial [Tremellales sp. Uapishka_1]